MRFKEFMQEEVIDARDKFKQRQTMANISREIGPMIKGGEETPAQKARGDVKAKIEACQKIFADMLKKRGLKFIGNIMQFLLYNDDAIIFIHQHAKDIREAAQELDKNYHAIYLELSKKDERHGLQAVQDAKRELKRLRRYVNEIAGKDIKPIEVDVDSAKKAIAKGEKVLARRTPRDEWKPIESDHKWNIHNYYARIPGTK